MTPKLNCAECLQLLRKEDCFLTSELFMVHRNYQTITALQARGIAVGLSSISLQKQLGNRTVPQIASTGTSPLQIKNVANPKKKRTNVEGTTRCSNNISESVLNNNRFALLASLEVNHLSNDNDLNRTNIMSTNTAGEATESLNKSQNTAGISNTRNRNPNSSKY